MKKPTHADFIKWFDEHVHDYVSTEEAIAAYEKLKPPVESDVMKKIRANIAKVKAK